MRITFKFNESDADHWFDEFESPPRVGDTVSFEGTWYKVVEVRWVLNSVSPGMGEKYVAVFVTEHPTGDDGAGG